MKAERSEKKIFKESLVLCLWRSQPLVQLVARVPDCHARFTCNLLSHFISLPRCHTSH